MHPGVAGGRRVDQFVERHLVGPGQREQQLQRRPALPPDSSRDSVLTEMPVVPARRARASAPLGAQRPQPGAHRLEDVVDRRCSSVFAIPATILVEAATRGWTVCGMTTKQQYDVVVIGGGAAGLSGALALARSRRSVLVVDAGEPRNAPADGVHNYLGREGTPPGRAARRSAGPRWPATAARS